MDSFKIRSLIIQENQQLLEKISKSQASFESRLEKTIKNLLENEIPRIKSDFDQEMQEILKEHTESINNYVSHAVLKSKIDPSENLASIKFLSGKTDKLSSNLNNFNKNQKENFGNPSQKIVKASYKDSINNSLKNSFRNSSKIEEISKYKLEEIIKPTFYDIKSTRNVSKPDSISFNRSKELELRKRFEKFQLNDSSSSSSLDSIESENGKKLKGKDKKKEKKIETKELKEKETNNSFLDSSSD